MFALSCAVIAYCAFSVLCKPAAQRIEREYGISIVNWK